MQDELRIEIPIAHRPYNIKIKRGDSKSEQTLRKAGKMVDASVQHFKKLGMKDKDNQDYLALTSLNIAVKLLDAQEQHKLTPLVEDLRELNFTLSSYLSDA
ncbi:MAG: cell division protein ZapA [Bacteroidota bacterium]|nr:cell division protein ZapA [Bacteroidota bacterium]